MVKKLQHFPKDDTCVICGTNEDRRCILIPRYGSHEYDPFHTDCLVDSIKGKPIKKKNG